MQEQARFLESGPWCMLSAFLISAHMIDDKWFYTEVAFFFF